MPRKKKGSGIHWGLQLAMLGFLMMLPLTISYYYGWVTEENIGIIGQMWGMGLMGLIFGTLSYLNSRPSNPYLEKHFGSIATLTLGVGIFILLILTGYFGIEIDGNALYLLSVFGFGAIIFGLVLYGNE